MRYVAADVRAFRRAGMKENCWINGDGSLRDAHAAGSNLSAVAHYKPFSRGARDSVNRNNKRQLIIGILTIDEKHRCPLSK